MYSVHDTLRRLVFRSGLYVSAGPLRTIAEATLHANSVITKCEQLVAGNGGESTIRTIVQGCFASNVPITLTECAKLVKQGSLNSQSNGQVQGR